MPNDGMFRLQSVMTYEERDAIRAAAAAADRTVSDYVRLILVEHLRELGYLRNKPAPRRTRRPTT